MKKYGKFRNFLIKKINSFNDWITDILSGITTTTQDNIIRTRSSGATVDLTCPDTVNYDLAMQLYRNTKSGYKLGAFFFHPIINIPMAFMGFPHFEIDDIEKQKNAKYWKKRLEFYNKKFMMSKINLQKICHITGTIAVFPWFDSRAGFVKLYFIKSKYITDIYQDPDRQELTGLETTINYTFNYDGEMYTFEEKKIYTVNYIETVRSGRIPSWMREKEIRRNAAGILPVIFRNDAEAGEFEGHSEFERILPIIKVYSEVNISAHQQAANMKTKLVQGVNNWGDWKKANGFTDINEVSIENVDLIVNKMPDEKTEFLTPQGFLDQIFRLLNLDFWSIVETSGVPEIVFGKKTEGNHASAAEQMGMLIAFAKEKQRQKQEAYDQLLYAIILLDAMAYNQNMPENLVSSWNELSTLTEVERSQVFDNWCAGIQKLADNHLVDLETIHNLLKDLLPGMITNNLDDFKEAIKNTGTLRAFLEQEYYDMKGSKDDAENIEDIENTEKEKIEVSGGNGRKYVVQV